MMGAHEVYREHAHVAPPSNRKFGTTLGGLFLALAGIRWWMGHIGPVTIGFAVLGALLLLLGLIAPEVLSRLNGAWMRLGALMAAVVNPIVMLLLFAIVFTPFAVAMRTSGRDPLGLRRKQPGQSYWHRREAARPAGERLRQQF